VIKSSYLEKLLNGAKIEWKKLGEVTNYQQPSKYLVKSENYNDNFDTPVLTAGKTFILGYTDEKDGIYKATKNPVIIFDDFTTANKWVNFDFKVKSSAMKIITSKDESEVLLKYVYYWLNNLPNNLNEEDYKRKWISNFSNKLIPIPPLQIQQEIVRILDAFTELMAELTAELTARKKQYEYYRNKLLTPIEVNGKWFLNGKEVEWKTLGELGELVRGNGLRKSDLRESGVPAIHYGQIYTYYGTFATKTKSFVSYDTAKKLKKVDAGDVVITNTSENIEDVSKAVVYLGQVQAVTGDHTTIFKPSNQILGKYFAYFTQTDLFANQKRKYAKGTKVIDVSATDMAKIIVPIPPLEEQERIVSILDKFNALINSITEEIELRQKQYEYYRDMLLSFPKKEDV
jgi:type I restriction enzyme S subunit